jgi:hypothetical protein
VAQDEAGKLLTIGEFGIQTRSRLSCREVYLTEPDAIGDDDAICDIAFPVG